MSQGTSAREKTDLEPTAKTDPVPALVRLLNPISGILFLCGIVAFCLSMYALVITLILRELLLWVLG